MPPPLNKQPSVPCTAQSSNCVIWDGPDIPCLKICRGDNLSHLLHKLATLLCNSTAGTVDITTLDFKCLVDLTPNPVSLAQTIQRIIDKICTVAEAVEELQENPDNDPSTDDAVLIQLPTCLRYMQDQDLVVSLSPTEHSKLLANKICEILSAIQTIQTNHSGLVTRVVELERIIRDLGIDDISLQVQLSCLVDDPASMTLQEGFNLVETAVCALRTKLGTDQELVQAIGRQCAGLGDEVSLLDRTTLMKNLSGWVLNPVTVADTITNLWLTICDQRAAFIDLASMLRATCADVILDFTFTPAANGQSGELVLYGKTILPANFRDAGTSALVISDGTNTISVPVDTYLLTRNAQQKQIIQLTQLDPNTQQQPTITSMLTFTLTARLQDEELAACVKTSTKQIRPLCDNKPVLAPSIVTTPTYTGGTFTWSAPLAATAPTGYYVEVWPQGADDPVLVTTTTVRSITIPNGTLVSDTTYDIFITALYDCAQAIGASSTLTTLECISIDVVATLDNEGTEPDPTPYLRINNEVIPLDGTETTVTSNCLGIFNVEYGLSASEDILHEVGQLYVNLVPVGTTLRTVDGVGFQEGTFQVTNMDPVQGNTIRFHVTTEI